MKKIAILLFLPVILFSQPEKVFVVKSILDQNRFVFQSEKRLTNRHYNIHLNSVDSGEVTIQSGSRVNSFTNYKYEYIAITSAVVLKKLKTGDTFTFHSKPEKKIPVYNDSFTSEKKSYDKSIVSEVDKREMVLVSGGITLIGSDLGQPHESPVHNKIIKSFYIDKYEVSNRDYLVFCKENAVNAPISWTNGEFPQKMADFPVMVTYYEAEAYAKWAGKRLPTEFEWERAANGVEATQKTVTNLGVIEKPFKTRYPWGNDLHNHVNYNEFWENNTNIPFERGLLPVYYYKERNVSFYGVVNMCGNAAEWTSSWYEKYPGANCSSIRFGQQVKVVRGGDYKSSADEITISSRAYGGLPDLHSDNRSGFRCVKDINRR